MFRRSATTSRAYFLRVFAQTKTAPCASDTGLIYYVEVRVSRRFQERKLYKTQGGNGDQADLGFEKEPSLRVSAEAGWAVNRRFVVLGERTLTTES
jgi:hypothetical protein